MLTARGHSGAWNGQVLLLVALLQVFSYPAHDPVMMDRGFLADRATTRAAFLHAFWISTLCILAFGLFGVQAGLVGAEYEGQLLGTWMAMFPPWVFVAIMVSLLVSALSTLDSALASAARLVVDELRLARAPWRRAHGDGGLHDRRRGADAVGQPDAVRRRGGQRHGQHVPRAGAGGRADDGPAGGAVVLSGRFRGGHGGAAAYFARDWPFWAALLPEGHKYEQLLAICLRCWAGFRGGAGRGPARGGAG